MNTITRYRVGNKFFADLFQAIDYAEKINVNVVNQVTGLIAWTPK